MKGRAGYFVEQSGGFKAFVPAPLPPSPPLSLNAETAEKLEWAALALGRLDGITKLLPDPDLFLYMYVRKEAVLSSQIEGTQSSLSDLLLFELADTGETETDVEEVSNYVAAMNSGIDWMRTKIPLSLRLLRQIHGVLVRGTRGADKTPGEFRRSQNWIGGSRPGNAAFVPPPPHELMRSLDNLEKFLHDKPERTPPLIKAGLAHAQFETIHPFLDGNGRVGRLLITLILVAEGLLSEPLLYISLYFKRHRRSYYEHLQRVRTHGAWEPWIAFYLDAIAHSATEATNTAAKINELFERDRKRIMKSNVKGHSVLHVFELLRRHAVLKIPEAAKQLEMSKPTIAKAVAVLENLGIVREVTGKQRDRRYMYREYVALLNEESD